MGRQDIVRLPFTSTAAQVKISPEAEAAVVAELGKRPDQHQIFLGFGKNTMEGVIVNELVVPEQKSTATVTTVSPEQFEKLFLPRIMTGDPAPMVLFGIFTGQLSATLSATNEDQARRLAEEGKSSIVCLVTNAAGERSVFRFFPDGQAFQFSS